MDYSAEKSGEKKKLGRDPGVDAKDTAEQTEFLEMHDEQVFRIVLCLSRMRGDRSLPNLSLGLMGRRLLVSDFLTSNSPLRITSAGSSHFG